MYKFIAVTLRITFRLNGGLEVIGIENIPADEGIIIAPNHVSYLDPPIIGAILPRNGNFMAKKGLFSLIAFVRCIKNENGKVVINHQDWSAGRKDAFKQLEK